ncbi:MAG: methyl-accepting chemotaxis protein [Oscillospiraceae bacterium]|nr:methyl-accepting chemotaxis protein [Oscillospiraceae bacterium]
MKNISMTMRFSAISLVSVLVLAIVVIFYLVGADAGLVVGVSIAGALACLAVTFAAVRATKEPFGVLNEFMYLTGKTGDIVYKPEEIVLIDKYKVRRDEIGALFRSLVDIVDCMIEVCDDLKMIADGDLAFDVKVRGDHDLLGHTLKEMVSDLNQMFSEIKNSATQVQTGSRQLSDGAQALAQGSTEQAATVQQLSSSASGILAMTKENANISKEAAGLSEDIKQNAEKGSVQMEQMMAAVKEINDASVEIEKVIKTIDDIAFQTNILALNAAVEAARAGQHGKGFAVVAEEVRNLAAKSAEAAKNTGGLIESSVSKANLGMNIAGDTSASLKEIVSGINKSAEIIATIAQSSEHQAGAIDQLNSGIDQVAHVVQQNSATAEQSAAASQEMSGQSDTLGNLTARFKLKDEGHRRLLPPGGNL